MCGIVGYIGSAQAYPILVEGLKRLEYRGYDSAGIALKDQDSYHIRRAKGKISELEKALKPSCFQGQIGIGHTRWATHGRPSEHNAHPHCAGDAIVVHNGIIENYMAIKKSMTNEGREFSSDTDSEVIAQLLDKYLKDGLEPLNAIQKTCQDLEGSYAAAILIATDPETLYGIRKESPMIVGLGNGECFLASDIPAILSHTRRMVFMEDGEIAVLRTSEAQFYTIDGAPLEKTVKSIDLNPVMAEKGGYKHFMLKEIFEQPRAVTDTFRGRISEDKAEVYLDELNISQEEINRIEKILIIACGTSYHAGLVGRQIIEGLTRIPVEVDLASEFRYRNPIVQENTLLVSISQSGETADTIAAAKEGAARGAKLVSICNVMESSLSRISEGGSVYTHAGPEIGVASTKAFTTQITTLYLLALYFSKKRCTLTTEELSSLIRDLIHLPGMMDKALDTSKSIAKLARIYERYSSFLYLGRGVNTAIAYEGALKLKEISYIHAEAYPGGEMKHGPIALISEDMPVVVVLGRNGVREKMLSNMEEVRSRGGIILAFDSGGRDEVVEELAEEVVRVPLNNEYLTTILLTLPLQLLAYHIADFKGTDVDQPRNLAKSVTVE